MLTTEEVDSCRYDGSALSLLRLTGVSFAVATLITIAWIVLGVLLVGS